MQIINLIHKITRKIGFDFRRYSADYFPELKRVKVIENQNINLVLDVGASEGFYGKELREVKYRGRIISFEPLEDSFQSLKKRCAYDDKWECYKVALGDTNSEMEMSVSGHVTSSSLLTMTDTHINAMPSSLTISKELIQVRTLNSFLSNGINIEDKIYLKLDVQGFEMFVLRGADKIFDQIKVIELELSLVPLYQGGPLFMDMIKHMDALGFKIISLSPVFSDPKTDQLLQVDAIFKKISHSI